MWLRISACIGIQESNGPFCSVQFSRVIVEGSASMKMVFACRIGRAPRSRAWLQDPGGDKPSAQSQL